MNTNIKRAAFPVLWLGFYASMLVVNAQPIVAPTTPARLAAGSDDPRDPLRHTKRSVSNVISGRSSTQPLLQRGPVALRPNLLYRILDVDGLRHSDEASETSSIIHTIAAGALMEIGSHFTVDYTFTRNFYSNATFRDETAHQANLAWMRSYDRWTFRVAQTYERGSPPVVETARQTEQINLSSVLTAIYSISSRARLEFDANRMSRDLDETAQTVQFRHADVISYSATGNLRYTISPRLNVGIGGTFGYDTINPGSDMSSYQPHAQLTWQPTKKITCSVQGGAETRRFSNRSVNKLESAVYNASLEYAPFDVTRLVVGAKRSISPSYFADGATKNSGWSAELEQRLLKNLVLSSSFARSEVRYFAIGSGFMADRRDSMDTFGVRLSTMFLQRGSAGLIYQYGRNDSTFEGYSLKSRQMGCELSYRF